MVSEKVGGAEGTKLDEEFKDLERVSRENFQTPLPIVFRKTLISTFKMIQRLDLCPTHPSMRFSTPPVFLWKVSFIFKVKVVWL